MAVNDIIVPKENASGTFDEITLPDATTSARGLLTSADKTKLDGIASGAEVNVNADWNASSGDAQILNKPTSFTPTSHAASHAAGIKASFNGQVAGMTSNAVVRANNVGTAGNSITLSFSGATKGAFTGQVAGMTTNVTIRAIGFGTSGNVTLSFDGGLTIQDAITDDGTVELVSGDGAQVPDDGEEIVLTGGGGSIQDVLAAWNSANPSNQATVFAGGSQGPNSGTSIALSGGVAVGSDPISDPAFNSIGIGVAAPQSAGQLIAIRTEEGGQDSLLKAISTANTTSTDANWRGRIMNGAENRTFLMGCYLGEAGLGAHSWSSAKDESGAAWADFLINPDGGADVFIGCQTWDKTKAILKVGNSDGKVTIADQASPTKKFNFDASGVTAGQTRSLSVPDASGVLALTTDAPASHTHGNLTNDGKVGSTSGLPLVTTTAGAVTTLALGTANQVLRTKSDLSGVEFADPAAAGVTSVTGTAPIVSSGGTTPAISVTVGTGANTVAAGDDSRFHTRSHAMTGTSDHTASNWSVFYSNGSGQVTELALGAANTVLTSNGASSAPSFAAASGGGATNLWIPASAWIPRTTGGCGVDSREIGATNRANVDELLFDTGTEEFAQALVVMPSNYNNGTVTARFYWSASSGSGGVAWGISGRAYGDDAALDQASGTRVAVTDTFITANDVHVTSATSAVTIDGTPAANKAINFQISRVVGDAADTLGVDARLLGVEIIFN